MYAENAPYVRCVARGQQSQNERTAGASVPNCRPRATRHRAKLKRQEEPVKPTCQQRVRRTGTSDNGGGDLCAGQSRLGPATLPKLSSKGEGKRVAGGGEAPHEPANTPQGPAHKSGQLCPAHREPNAQKTDGRFRFFASSAAGRLANHDSDVRVHNRG